MNPENDLIAIQSNKEITRLYKSFLEIIEDIKINQAVMLQKVADKHGSEFAQNVNFFTEQYYEQLRKRILDAGNDCNRQLLAFLDFFDFIINKEKVETVATQRRVVKKVIINPPLIIE